MLLKKINKILVFLIIIILSSILFLKLKKYKIINYQSDFYKVLNSLVRNESVKKFNFETFYNVNKNDLVILNIFDINNQSFINNLNMSKYLLGKYKNISVYNIIVDNNMNKFALDLSSLIDDDINEIIYKYNINEPTIYVNGDIFNNNKYLSDNLDKVIILDKIYNKIFILNNDVGVDEITEKINNISTEKVYFNRNIVSNNKLTKSNDDFVYKNMSKIISLENFNGKNLQMFAILDTSTKNILLIKPDGEIKYIIDCRSFCSPSNIKYFDNKLYITDSCDGSIEYFDFNDKKLKVFVKNHNLVGISDFEFIDDDYILISKINSNDSLGILNNNTYTSINDLSEYNKKITTIPKIDKFNDKYYYFDSTNRTLYFFDGSKSDIVVQLSDEFYDRLISSFYVNSYDDIYFIYDNSSYILRYYNGTFSEQYLGDSLVIINDFLINKNLFFKLSDDSLEIIDVFYKTNSNIKPFIGRDTENFGDLIEHINLYDDYNFCDISKLKENIYDFIGVDKESTLQSSFLMFFLENDDKLTLQKVVYWPNIYDVTNITSDIKYIFGKLYYKDNMDNLRTRYINCKINF